MGCNCKKKVDKFKNLVKTQTPVVRLPVVTLRTISQTPSVVTKPVPVISSSSPKVLPLAVSPAVPSQLTRAEKRAARARRRAARAARIAARIARAKAHELAKQQMIQP